MLFVLILVLAMITSIMAIRSKGLISSALWLAGTSALVALTIYLLGAPEIAVIELSVGAGLVTVLFVFAISIIREEDFSTSRFFPRPVAWILIGLFVLLFGWFCFSRFDIQTQIPAVESLSRIIWENRNLDIIVQVVMIFSGVLGVLGLLAESRQTKHTGVNS